MTRPTLCSSSGWGGVDRYIRLFSMLAEKVVDPCNARDDDPTQGVRPCVCLQLPYPREMRNMCTYIGPTWCGWQGGSCALRNSCTGFKRLPKSHIPLRSATASTRGS